MKTLKQATVGETVKVVKLHGEGAIKRRIMDMGLTKGVEVYVRKVAPLGDPQMPKFSRCFLTSGLPPIFFMIFSSPSDASMSGIIERHPFFYSDCLLIVLANLIS